MAASTSTAKTPYTGNDDDDDLAPLLALQQEELMAVRTAHSDLDFAFQLQMNEAIAASASLSPSSSSTAGFIATGIDSQSNDDFAAAADLFADEISRFEREQANLQLFKAEMRRMRDDFDLRLHDRKVASEIFAISEHEWKATGDYYERPYGMKALGSTSAVGGSDLGFGEYFYLYIKGLVVVEDQNRAKLGAIAVAIFDSADTVVLEVAKPLVLPQEEMRNEVTELEAFIHGLELALSLELSRVVYSCVDFNVDHYLLDNQKPKEAKVVELIDRAARLKTRFLVCRFSHGTKNNAHLVLELARSSIAKQTGKPVKEIILIREKCPICFEDVDSGEMFEMVRCHHRFCSSCMQKYVKLKVHGGELPRCPQPDCQLELNINTCRKFVAPEMYDAIDQLVKESSIPAADKVYCPNPTCSNLMSKNEALANIQNVAGTSRAVLTTCRCMKCLSLFCINCKVLWHSNMSCDVYKKQQSGSSSADSKLKLLAGNKKWRQCPRCSHMVELAEGCNHIYCRCGHQFCYLCGREWRNKKATCSCLLWSEENIIRHDGANVR